MNPIMQLSGISILILLVYDSLFNYEENKKYKNNYVSSSSFIAFLGNIDLILGVLLVIKWAYEPIPIMGLIFLLTIMLFLKAFPFAWGGDIASVIDIISSIVIFSSGTINIPSFIIIGIAFYLIQKGVLSFF